MLFTLLLSPGAPATVPAYDTGGLLFGMISEHLRMLGLAVPAFGFLGWLGADRLFAAQEQQYQALIDAGARVPEQKPVMQMSDRGPALAVAIAAAIIAGFIIVLFIMASTGAL